MTIKIKDVTIECGDGVSVQIDGEKIIINAMPLQPIQPLFIPSYPAPLHTGTPDPWWKGPTCEPYKITWGGSYGTSCFAQEKVN